MTTAHTCSRRTWLFRMLGGVASTPFILRHAHAARRSAPLLRGCCLRDPGLSQALLAQSRLGPAGSGTDTTSSGDVRFDQALGTLLADLAGRFQVRPGFGWYDDGALPNAVALEASHLSHSRGTVLVGREMLRRGLRSVHGDMFLMGVCAHEFAHIVQFFSAYHARLSAGQATQKRVELHADFLSGYYIGLREVAYTPPALVALGRTWEALGDSAYTDPQHHGTPDERLRAIEAGFAFARERPEFGIAPACEVGARYLRA